jgi:Uma2 family endonuclease
MTTSLEFPLTQPKMGEKRVIFYGLNWQRYQQILQALGNNRSARLTYDEGTLEITMPLEDHDYAVRLIELFIRVLVVETGLKIKTMGSTTLDRADLNRGAEPDSGFYIQNQPLVKGRNVDLTKDPPPDLVVEVDITHSDINKLQLYARMGVPEFWRYDGQALQIYQLQEDRYCETEVSSTFPTIPKIKLYEFLEQAREDEVEAEVALRQWVRSQAQNREERYL